ncbi:MAG TPA: YfiR family protein [Ramlibacter sp.]|nr:YfiR family protein [Ramlibacter sp.]
MIRSWAPRRRLLVLAGALAASGVRAQGSDRLRESLVKAAFLLRFPSFVEWPAGTFSTSESALRIGIAGDDELMRDLRSLARDRAPEERPVVVGRLVPGESLAGFHVVYVRAGSPARMSELLAAAPEGVLTVVDADGQHPPGAVLSFYTEEGRIRFGASVGAAGKQRLRLSSRLLTIARQVQGFSSQDIQLA